MYNVLLNIHSVFRWILLLLLIFTILKALVGWVRNQPYQSSDDKLSLLTLIFTHTQLVIGFILYFMSPIVASGLQNMANAMKQPEIRFWTVEHLTGMLIAIILITIGRISSKKKSSPKAKFKTVVVYYSIGLVIMVYMIPWERFVI